MEELLPPKAPDLHPEIAAPAALEELPGIDVARPTTIQAHNCYDNIIGNRYNTNKFVKPIPVLKWCGFHAPFSVKFVPNDQFYA